MVGDDCGVFWGYVCRCTLSELCDCGVAGCGGTTDCGGVCCIGLLLVLVEPMGVHCPQGSELSGEVSAFCGSFVWCVLTGSGDASGAIGSNVGVGLGRKPEVESNGVLGEGYMPGYLSCLLMRSASPVTLNDDGGVIQFGEELDVIEGCKTINDW